MPNPTAAILIIGDEILSGRTRDTNMHYLARELATIGIDLCEVHGDRIPLTQNSQVEWGCSQGRPDVLEQAHLVVNGSFHTQ